MIGYIYPKTHKRSSFCFSVHIGCFGQKGEWDIGGQDKIRRLWKHYYPGTQGIIFVVDSSDKHRIDTAREELHKLAMEPELEGAAILVLANKQDLPDAMTTAEVVEDLGLMKLRGNAWFAQGATATTGEGLYEGLDWLHGTLKAAKDSLRTVRR